MSEIKPIALILAAGESSRFEPLANAQNHKAMLTLLGRPILDYVLEDLAKAGFKRAVIARNASDVALAEYFRERENYGLEVKFEVQLDLKAGMAGAVLAAQKYLTEPFLVLTPSHFDVSGAWPAILKAKAGAVKAVLCGQVTQEPERCGIFKLEGDRVVDIIEKPEPSQAPSDIRVVGLYLLSPEFLVTLAKEPVNQYGFESALAKYVRQQPTRLIKIDGPTYSLKNTWDLFGLNEALLARQQDRVSQSAQVSPTAAIQGMVIVEDGAVIHEYAVIKGPCYIGKNAVVGDHALIRGATSLAEAVKIGPFSEVARSIVMEQSSLHSGYLGDSIIGRQCHLGAGFITANRRLDRQPVKVTVKGERVSTGRIGLGVIMGHRVMAGIRVGTMPGITIGSDVKIGPGEMIFKDL